MKWINRKTWVGLCLVSVSWVANIADAKQILIPAAPQLNAKSYILMDAVSGKVLVEHEADVQLPPASLTKMLTSYIVSEEIETGRLQEDELVTISDNAWKKGGPASGSSTMFLDPRSQVPVIELMKGVIIQSGNDASIALAEHIAGSEVAFADIMNQQATLLGMENSNFKNATGWPAKDHYSTARDMAILGRAVAMDHPEHYAIYSQKSFTHNNIKQSNRNKLLFSNKFVDGLKTGHTKEAGYCLVSSAEQDGMRLVAVVLGTKSKKARAAESQRLLVYGFRNFQTNTLYAANNMIVETKVWSGETDNLALGVADDVIATIPKGSQANLVAETEIDTVIKAPIKQGQVLGKLIVKLDGELIVEQDLVAMSDGVEAGFFSRMIDSIMLMISSD